MTPLWIALLAIGGSISRSDDTNNWSYERQDLWPGQCRTSKRQSPIALSTFEANIVDLPPLNFDDFYQPVVMQMENTGNGIMLKPIVSRPIRLTGGGLIQTYLLDNVHFHWDSEHTIDSFGYGLEAHFVLYAEKYGSLDDAINRRDGITVIATLYKIVFFPDEIFRSNRVFDQIVSSIPRIATNVSRAVSLPKPVNMAKLLPPDWRAFFRYDGSLTTPPCSSGVNWIVLMQPSFITHSQWIQLKRIFTRSGRILESNRRYIQKVNNRKVLLNVF